MSNPRYLEALVLRCLRVNRCWIDYSMRKAHSANRTACLCTSLLMTHAPCTFRSVRFVNQIYQQLPNRVNCDGFGNLPIHYSLLDNLVHIEPKCLSCTLLNLEKIVEKTQIRHKDMIHRMKTIFIELWICVRSTFDFDIVYLLNTFKYLL